MKPPPKDSDNLYPVYVGPYKIGKTLGQGQTGTVKIGIHCKTKEKVAIKIINKQKLKPSVLQKVEREVAIMRLIEHPHVLGLYDVYESSRYLYLVLEHVAGGELFDYLVKKGRLSQLEARKFFTQIISAVDFCHKYGVCHRDLKPENLLLDEHKNIKVADFGMASLQLENSLLETSCGSPHYACPEVIKGGPYDGKLADTWSSGIILYALLVGHLPFDHQDMGKLLERVRLGKYNIPYWVSNEAKTLIGEMLQVEPEKRIKLRDVFKHEFMKPSSTESARDYLVPIETVLYTQPLNSKDDLDTDIMKQMSCLGCFKNSQQLQNNLLEKKHNMEKVIYFLLLDRKQRQPAVKDSIPLRKRWKNRASNKEYPTKRVDKMKFSPSSSPAVSPLLSSHRSLCKATSLGTGETTHNLTPKTRRLSLGNRLGSITEVDKSSRWSRILSTFSSSTSSSHRSLDRLTSHPRTLSSGRDISKSASGLVLSTPSIDQGLESRPRSFLPWKNRHKEIFLVLRGTTLRDFNINIVHLFQKYDVTHTLQEDGYTCKYQNSRKGLLSKSVKFSLAADERNGHQNGGDAVICVTITFRSGSTKKFKSLCEKFQISLFRPSTGRPFSPILRKVCSYFSESDCNLNSIGSMDVLSSSCYSDPSLS